MAQIIVCVPGPWADPKELVQAMIASAKGAMPEYLLAGQVMMHIASKRGWKVEQYPPDPAMVQAFEYAGQGQISAETMAKIGEHRSVVYLVCPTGPEAARSTLGAAAALLDAGGFAVKVESAGVAHEPERWHKAASLGTTLAAYDMLVTLVGGEGVCFSCGMHHFGLADAAVPTSLPVDKLPELMTALNQRQLLGVPATAGELFATELDAEVLELIHQPYGYPEDSPLNNPHGRWLMAPTPVREEFARPEADGPLMMAIATDSPEIVQATERARQTWPRLVAFLRGGFGFGRPLVKVRLEKGEDSGYFWLLALGVDGDTVQAEVFELPPAFGLPTGSSLSVSREQAHDWAIIRHGALVGGFTMRVQRALGRAEHRRFMELYTGVLCEEPLAEMGFAEPTLTA